MADKFKGFWMMEAGERDEKYLHPATPEDVAIQLRKMGYLVLSKERLIVRARTDSPARTMAIAGMLIDEAKAARDGG